MIQPLTTLRAMIALIGQSLTAARVMRLCMAATILTVWIGSSGCAAIDYGWFRKRATVIESNDLEQFVRKGESFTAPTDGVFMADARYRRYRRAVADEILRLESERR